MKIIIDRDIPYIGGVFEPYAEVVYLKGTAISARDISEADALVVRTRTKCDERLLSGSRVKMIASATIGFDHIDMDYCATHGIRVATAAGSNARGVLQWIGAALVYASEMQGWQPTEKTLGVVGVGHVGTLVAEYALKWGFRVQCCDPPRRRKEGFCSPARQFVKLEDVARQCDIITFHTPLIRQGLDKTYHMAGDCFFGMINPGTLIINSSRGEVVDSAALRDSLELSLCSTTIDTWEHEPDIDRRLLELSMLATPHIAGYSAQGKANATSMSVQAIAREFGLPLTDWYPSSEIPVTTPRPICWDELRRTIHGYLNIETQSRMLKSHPENFETLRNTYIYRQEYF